MEICGEHGEDIVYGKVARWDTCPACEQIEDIKKDHEKEIAELEDKIAVLEGEFKQ